MSRSRLSPDVNGPYQCSRCQNTLKLQGPARTGKFPGQFFLHCCSCQWHYTFPAGTTPCRPWESSPLAPTSDILAAASKSNPSAADTTLSQLTQTTTGSKRCSGPTCGRVAHASCQNICCKSCCIKRGGCLLAQHKASKSQVSSGFVPSSSTNSLPHPPVPAAFIPTSPSSSLTTFENCAQLFDPNPVLQLKRQDELAAETERKFAEQEQEVERQEEEEFQRVLAACREDLYSSVPASTSYVSTSHTVPPGNSEIISASTSSLPGPISPPPTSSSMSSSLLVGGRPVTQVSSRNKPTITNHLPPNWMRPYEDRTQQPQALTGRGQLDIEMVQRFRVVWWEKDDKTPATFIVHVCPQWPKWRISDCPTTLKRLGEEEVEFYDLKHHLWLECPISLPHLVKTDDYFFLRRVGIECKDFEARLELATRPPSTSRTYMTTARKSLRAEARVHSTKRKGKEKAIDDDDHSEVEVLGSPVPISKRKKVKREPSSPSWPPSPFSPPPSLRLPLMSPTGYSFGNPISISDSSPSPSGSPVSSSLMPTGSMSTSAMPVPSRSITPITVIPVLSMSMATADSMTMTSPSTGPPPLLPGSKVVWPSNMYTIDMVYGFRQMDQLLKAKEGTYASRFSKVFNQPPAAESTYYDQVQRWEIGSPALRKAALEAGRSSAGHWSTYAKQVPLKTLK